MKHKPKKARLPPWTPFTRMDTYVASDGTRVSIPDSHMVVKNSRYQVEIRKVKAGVFGPMAWLSIKSLDREARHDWREFQRIKNELCGPEHEGVELYPAESRLVDTSNQYHLFVPIDGSKFPFGFQERLVTDAVSKDPLLAGAKQRPWPPGERPSDLTDPDVALAAYMATKDQTGDDT